MNDQLLTIDQVAEKLAVKRGTVYNLMRSGDLDYIKIRGATRFTPEAVSRFVDSCAEKPEQGSSWK